MTRCILQMELNAEKALHESVLWIVSDPGKDSNATPKHAEKFYRTLISRGFHFQINHFHSPTSLSSVFSPLHHLLEYRND